MLNRCATFPAETQNVLTLSSWFLLMLELGLTGRRSPGEVTWTSGKRSPMALFSYTADMLFVENVAGVS